MKLIGISYCPLCIPNSNPTYLIGFVYVRVIFSGLISRHFVSFQYDAYAYLSSDNHRRIRVPL